MMTIKEKFIKLKQRIDNNYLETSREQWYWVKYHIDDLEKGDTSNMTRDVLIKANKLWKEYE